MFCEKYVEYLKECEIANFSGQDYNMSAKEDIFMITIKTIKTFSFPFSQKEITFTKLTTDNLNYSLFQNYTFKL